MRPFVTLEPRPAIGVAEVLRLGYATMGAKTAPLWDLSRAREILAARTRGGALGTQSAFSEPWQNARKKFLKNKALRKAFKKYPYGVAAALVAVGSVFTAVSRSGQFGRLKEGAMRRLQAARNSLRDDALAQHH